MNRSESSLLFVCVLLTLMAGFSALSAHLSKQPPTTVICERVDGAHHCTLLTPGSGVHVLK